MTYRWCFCLVALAAACGGGRAAANPTVSPSAAPPSESASPATIDSLWSHAEAAVRQGKWGDAEKLIERMLLEVSPGDPRIPQAHYWLGEAYFARGRHLEAAREFRKASDETPNHPLAPEALVKLVQAYKTLGYREDVQETCDYIRRFHPKAPGAREVCPTDSTGA